MGLRTLSVGCVIVLFVLDYKLPSGAAPECEAAIREFRDVAAEKRRVALRGARAVLELERTGAHFQAGAASIAHFAEMNGMAAYEARELSNLSRALIANAGIEAPSLEDRVAAGTIPVGSAAILGQVAAAPEPDFIRPDDRWLEWAETKSTRDFRRIFERRRDEVRAGQAVTPLTAYVTVPVLEQLERARELVSRAAHSPVTMGQTLGVIVDAWLADHDPLRTRPGTRRLPDTATIPDSRYVPAAVDREVRARSNDRCCVPFCGSGNWVQRSHRIAHVDGGDREAEQLDLLCDYHHKLYESGKLRIEGPASAPIFTDSSGHRLDKRNAYMTGSSPPTANGMNGQARAEVETAPSTTPLPETASTSGLSSRSKSPDRRSRKALPVDAGPEPPRA